MRRSVVALAMLAGVILTAGFAALRYFRRHERPEYRVVDRRRGWELREYPPTIEARVVVPGGYERAVREGFRVLAAYLFGANVTSDVASNELATSEKIAMTAPVSVTESPDGWTVAFTMPDGYDLDDLPRPIDPRIQLVEVPGRRLAARKFSGIPKRKSIDRESRRLQKALDQFGIEPHDALIVAHYDPPMVPWFLRRNEVLVAVA